MVWWRRRFRPDPDPGPAVAEPTEIRSEPRAGEVSARSYRSAAILAGLGGATVTVFGISAIQGFFAPVFLALILTICAHPLRLTLERHGTPQGVATGTVIAAVFALLAAFVAALVVAFAQFAALLPQYVSQIQEIGQTIANMLAATGLDQQQIQAVVSNLDSGRIVAVVGGILGSVTGMTFALVIILTTLILMAMDATSIPKVFGELEPEHPAVVEALQSFAIGVRKYMVATTGLGIAQGVLNWVALLLLGVPGAFLWGLLAFICSFIPNIGYFIALIPPLRSVLGGGHRPNRGNSGDPAHPADPHSPDRLQPGCTVVAAHHRWLQPERDP